MARQELAGVGLWPVFGLATLLALTLLAYLPFVGTGFAATDSLPLVETSRFSSLAEAARQFSQPVMAGTRFTLGEVVYRPFVSLTFGLDHLLWGLDPRGYHVTNIVVHLLAVVSLAGLLATLGLRAWSALAGAALFAWHPLVLASVPVIARRDSILPVAATVAASVALLAADDACGRRRMAWLALALTLLALAMLSKESAFLSVGLLIMLVFARGLARGCSVGQAARAGAGLATPVIVLGAAIFVWRLILLRGLGGGDQTANPANLTAIDVQKYSQTVGAFVRDLAWVVAGLAPSTREVWPRAAAVLLIALLVASWPLRRDHRILLLTGTAWTVIFILFAAVLKIQTVAWLGYFALVGLALLFAAGLEGGLATIRQLAVDGRPRSAANRLMAGGLLAGLGVYALATLGASPLFRSYNQWQVAGDVTGTFMAALDTCTRQRLPTGQVVVEALPSSFEDGRVETPLLGVTLLEDYTVDAMLRLLYGDQAPSVSIASYETLRGGADTLHFSCTAVSAETARLTVVY